MDLKRLSAVAIFMVFLVSFASASSFNAEFTQVGNKVVVKEKIVFDSLEEITLKLPLDYTGLSANVNYTIINGEIKLEGKNIELSYVTSEIISSNSGEYYFVYKLVFPSDFDGVDIKFNLDEGFVVDEGNIFPAGAGIDSDGRRISVSWALDDAKKGESEALFVKFNQSGGNIWVYIILAVFVVIIFIVIAAALIIYFVTGRKTGVVRVKKKSKEKKEERDYTLYLVEGEKKVIEALRAAPKNEMWQKQLQISTGFSKAKMSRMVRNLESRGLIEKIPLGNTNKIKLKNYLE